MKKALKIIYVLLGAIVTVFLWYVGAFEEITRYYGSRYPRAFLGVACTILWIVLWPFVVIFSLCFAFIDMMKKN